MATKSESEEKVGKPGNDMKCQKTQDDDYYCKYSCMCPNKDGTFTIFLNEETLSEQQAKIYCRRCNLEDGF